MAENFITYRCGYKYQLASDYEIDTEIRIHEPIDDKLFLKMDVHGLLSIKKGYAWDGPSGPVIDSPENMRASLVHDALYQLMRNEYLDREKHKDDADKLFKVICIDDGVKEEIAHIYYLGLKIGGRPSTEPKNKKKIYTAP